MKTNKLMSLMAAFSICSAIGAQTSFDAAKLYEEELNGTARYVGMGGAMSALGSDLSVISHNPAGIGTYHNSDVNMSVSFFGASVNTDPLCTSVNPGDANGCLYYSNNVKSDINVAFDNFSAVFSGFDAGDNYVNFGISYRKLQNMDRIMDYYDGYVDADDYPRLRDYKDHQRNKVNSFDFNISCNLSDLVYLGWTVGILSTDTWSEGLFDDVYEDITLVPDSLLHDTSVDKMNTSKGSGWNMAFGVIVRPIPALRLGASIKTPTYYKQKLDYVDYLYYKDGVPQDGLDDVAFEISQDYSFSSPWSLNLSAGLTIGKTAIGAEFERHFTQRSSLSISNTRMDNQGAIDYKDYSSLKLGIEQNISNLSLRAGYNLVESMFNANSVQDISNAGFNSERMDFQLDRPGKKQYFTGGIGYCSAPDRDGTQFYFDLAYVHGIRNSELNMMEYFDADGFVIDPYVNYQYKTDKVLLTFGWSF